MKILLVSLFLLLPTTAFAQAEPSAEAVVALQRIYAANLMGQGTRPGLDAQLDAIAAPANVRDFFRAGLRGAPVLASEYLALPDREALEMVFAVDSVHQASDEGTDLLEVARAALAGERDVRRLAHNYYRMLFRLASNKVRPFDLSGYDFDPLAYTGGDAELAAIFYLEAMKMSQSHIWGLLNIANPPNYAGAAEILANFPRFNGEPYYAFTAVDPGDFSAYIAGSYRPYRPYYINEHYKTLLYHLRTLMETGGSREAAVDLVSRSIITRPKYHQYFETPDVLARLSSQVNGSN